MQPEIRRIYWYAPSRRTVLTIIKIALVAAGMLICGSLDTPAQKQDAAAIDCRSGEIAIDPASKRPPVIRLGLSRDAVSIVEFPTADSVLFLHQGNAKFAAVFDSPNKAMERSIMVFAGEEFGARESARAAITLQMRSGVVFVLEYSAAALRDNSFRCFVRYNVNDAIIARKNSGLATNENAMKPEVAATTDSPGKDDESDARSAVEHCLREISPCFVSWSNAKRRIGIGVSKIFETAGGRQVVVIAVRNDAAGAVRLAPGFPSLRLTTTDERGRVLESAPVRSARLVRFIENDRIEPQTAHYFAFVFDAPVTGSKQRLVAIAAARDAADAPVSVAVPTN